MQARTVNTIQKALSKTQPNRGAKNKEDPYLRCVFEPFRSLGRGMMRPDSGSDKIIMRDILQSFDIVTNLPIGLKLSPMYPYVLSVWNQGLATVNINGVTIPNGIEALGVGFTPLAGKAESDYLGNSFAMTDYDRARISTIGWRLMYTGKSLDAQGYVLVDHSPFTIDLVDRMTPATCTYATSVGTNVTYPAVNNNAYVQIETALFTNSTFNAFTPINPTQTSQLFRPEAGAQGVLRRSAYSPNHPFKPVYNGGAVPFDNRNPNPEAARCFISSAKPVPAGVTIIDDEFDSTMIYITGPGNYRLELVVCLEAIVTQQSVLEPLAKASPPLNQKVLEKESKVMAGMPPAVAIDKPIVPFGSLVPDPSIEDKLLRLAQTAVNNKTKNVNTPQLQRKQVIVNPKKPRAK